MPVLRNAEFVSKNDSNNEAASSNNDEMNSIFPTKEENASASFKQYLMSIIYMPHSLRMICLTNLFCWMAHVRHDQFIPLYYCDQI